MNRRFRSPGHPHRWAAAEARLRGAPPKILTGYSWNGPPEVFGGVAELPASAARCPADRRRPATTAEFVAGRLHVHGIEVVRSR